MKLSKISYLGPKGTYSEKAAEMFIEKTQEKTELVDLPSLEAVARSLTSNMDNKHRGVMAYYNYLEGLVQECLDLIYENNLKIIGMQRIPIEFSIGSYPENSDYSKIYSHPKALAQCSEYLQKNYPKSNQIPVQSTAAGVEMIKKTKSGLAIARRDVLIEKKGDKNAALQLIATNINNKRHGRQNYTDFYVVSREDSNYEYRNWKKHLTMIAITPPFDRVGLLADILVQIKYYGLNIVKIYSRPTLDKVKVNNNGEPQMFYLELMCHRDSNEFSRCIDSLKWGLAPKESDIKVVQVLGSYEAP